MSAKVLEMNEEARVRAIATHRLTPRIFGGEHQGLLISFPDRTDIIAADDTYGQKVLLFIKNRYPFLFTGFTPAQSEVDALYTELENVHPQSVQRETVRSVPSGSLPQDIA